MATAGDLISFGRFVRERRRELGLTQEELGARVGWAQERLSVLERGTYGMPSLPQLCRLAAGLMLSPEDLLRHTGIQGLSPAVQNEGLSDGKNRLRVFHQEMLGALDRMHVVEEHLHEAQNQVERAADLRASIEEQQQKMAHLLDSCHHLDP